ncbi:exodeoxyribonuclease VII large subunit [Solemya pervernicosa gill symbiont]|uniref:Exodeoxyribonuclease 7 large subunit n=3 Tax=Gammaproteobacteria incertae sedis TaxID=118884 RepID=A0A1T2LB51_9GAMM|nr:exodeoxyribonuclease VII large subunit [Solemya pervernicosa gill symbiont]QKQ28279.1 exodeoxyribonuclease VII large subunit [Candidatus Reidiella endopervernicosa]
MRPTVPNSAPQRGEREIYTVSRLTREVRMLLEGSLPMLWVEGEISNLAQPASGHIYFTLKDANSQVRCAMFRNRRQMVRFKPENGMQVQIRARAGLYEARGEFQLVAESMQEAGAGALQREFEALKRKLAAEGLFDETSKIPLPTLPKRIGVITSPTGAAVRDIISVLKRRFPAIPITIYPVAVQGEGAAEQIADAIDTAVDRYECDVLIVGRGGGSLEDLWAFNEEVVARAIFDSSIPIVSAVGHEIDFTIADFVADVRAPTPSAAAELLSPDRDEIETRIAMLQRRITARHQSQVGERSQRINWLASRLQRLHPGQQLRGQYQRLDELSMRLSNTVRAQLRSRHARLDTLNAHLQRYRPHHRIETLSNRLSTTRSRLHTTMQRRLEQQRQQFTAAARALDTVSPLATLDRGYAIVRRQDDQQIIRQAAELQPGERVETRLSKGNLICTVEECNDD